MVCLQRRYIALYQFRAKCCSAYSCQDFGGSLQILHLISPPPPCAFFLRGRWNLWIFNRISRFLSIYVLFHSIVGATVKVHQFFCILHFCHTCSLYRVELVVQFPERGATQVLSCLFPGVLWLWHFLRGAFGKSCTFTHIILHSDQSKKMKISILTSGHGAFGSTMHWRRHLRNDVTNDVIFTLYNDTGWKTGEKENSIYIK